MKHSHALITSSLLAVLCASPLVAEDPQVPQQPMPAFSPPPLAPNRPIPTAVVTANAEYKAGPLHRAFFGGGYRKLWATPVRVEVLDLGTVGGGLTPEKKGGGMQTKSLHFDARDGRKFRVRSVDKDPSKTVPKMLRGTFAEQIIQDQMSSAHPAGTLVVEGLEEAVGLLHRPRRMVVVPDDPRLGAFRQEFAGMLVVLEEKPSVKGPVTEGFENVEDIEEWEEFKPMLEKGEARIDARAFLKARLVDILVGDWDRHPGQWEWAKVRGSDLWQPIPTDRDQAFARFDGLVVKGVRFTRPQLVTFESDYPSVVGLSWNSREIDRLVLGVLDRAAFQAAATELQHRITDTVIEQSAQRMPPEYFRLSGESLVRRLKTRRNNLPQAAMDFYELLAHETDIHLSNQAETVQVVRGENDGRIELRAFRGNDPRGEPLWTRTFVRGETEEIRLYLHGGDDTVVSQGPHEEDIILRAVGGPGNDVVDDSQGGHTRIYDHDGELTFKRGKDSKESSKRFEHPRDERGYPMRDWGRSTMPVPVVEAEADLGVLFGLKLNHYDYGFRRIPWSSLQSVGFAYASQQKGFRAFYDGEFRYTNSRKRRRVFARYSDVEVIRFHGFGNETRVGPSDFHKTDLRQWLFEPSLRFGFDAPMDFSVGGIVKYTQPQLERGLFLDRTRPYGSEDLGQVGIGTRLTVDSRDVPRNARKGVLFELGGRYWPKAWGLDEEFAEAYGEFATYLTPASPVTLALRAAGKKLWGRFPFYEAAFLGGSDTLRGMRRNRYAGDSMAVGNAELRFRLFELKLFVPIEVGAFGLADGGRVWLKGEDSDTWHHAFGGGLSFSFIKPANTLVVSIARGDQGEVRTYLRGGFAF
ncbi:MAG TPA: BamA/TamA family outer membrane protein [Vicinamibacteria bacterium]|nr:BamA/TamA family outer membrane protein [Vicinamibacteria bacterium]